MTPGNHDKQSAVTRWILVMCAVVGCGDNLGPPVAGDDYQWELPAHFPEPVYPLDNPMTAEKVELGRHLFYDERVSEDQTASCATCHRPDTAFAGPEIVAISHDGSAVARSVPSLVNAAYMTTLTWASPDMYDLEQLVISAAALQRLRQDPVYESIETARDVTNALAVFTRTIISGAAPYDVYVYGRDTTAMSESAVRGFELFWSDRLRCSVCHEGFNLTRSTKYDGLQGVAPRFQNTGLYNVDGGYPASDRGLAGHTGLAEDDGMFRAPSLRNVALTAPYYHDGSAADLDDVLDDYAAGGRVTATGPNAGDGRANPNKHEAIAGFELSESERADLHAFFEALTDPTVATADRLSNPWIE